jgi:predicted O-methyltransferase YrrM
MPHQAAMAARAQAEDSVSPGLGRALDDAPGTDRTWLGWLRGALSGPLAGAFPGTAPPPGGHDPAEEQPWLVPEAIPFIEARLNPGMAALEWGAGRSTVWLARLGLAVVSIEARADWVAAARGRVAAAGLAGRVRFVLVERPRAGSLAEACAEAASGYGVHSFDLVLVDGPFKAACLRRAGAALKPGGLLVLDDAHAADVAAMADQLAPYRLASFDNGIWQTVVFQAPAEDAAGLRQAFG